MSTVVQNLLSSFDNLSELDKHQAAVEILKRTFDSSPLSDEELISVAEEAFVALDAAEATHAKP